MKSSKRLLAYCFAILLVLELATANVFAQTTPPELPPDVASAVPNAEVVGKGKLTFFGLDVYDSSLWTTPSFKGLAYENHSFALEDRKSVV